MRGEERRREKEREGKMQWKKNGRSEKREGVKKLSEDGG